MKMKLLALAVVAASGVVALKTPAVAHHAFSAEFDANLPVRLGGPITRVEWINPHTWIHLENSDAESTRDPGAWMVEGGTPNTLLRRGINRNTLVLGTDIVVTGYQSKDRLCEPTCRANGRDITPRWTEIVHGILRYWSTSRWIRCFRTRSIKKSPKGGFFLHKHFCNVFIEHWGEFGARNPLHL